MGLKNKTLSICKHLFTIIMVFITITSISCFKEKRDWKNAKHTRTIESYKAFLNAYPESKFKKQANDSLQELTWESARSINKKYAYDGYLYEFPNGIKSDSAYIMLLAIDWQEVKDSNTISAYNNFLSRYDTTIYHEEVKNKIEELSWTEAKEIKSKRAFKQYARKFPNTNRLPFYSGTIKSVDITMTFSSFGGSSSNSEPKVKIKLVEYPSVVFNIDLWDASDYGVVKKVPMEGFSYFANYSTGHAKGWKVRIVCLTKDKSRKNKTILAMKVAEKS